MAEFCQACSIDLFGVDHKEFALDPSDPRRGTLKKGYGWGNLCEGCGPITTDDDGKCQGLCMKLEHGGLPNTPTTVWMPHPNEMERGARFVWHTVHYLVVRRGEEKPYSLVLAPWSRWNRFKLWLGWGKWHG